jgi:glycosyltransferase involved in cell wall biosynthesis
MFARVQNRADAIAYVSQFTADEFHRLLGAPRGHEKVIPCGVDEAWFAPPDVQRPERPYLLFVGNVKPHKNLPRLLDAFDRIKADIPHDLIIVGRKEGFITVDNSVLDRITGFAGRVAFTGYVPDDALRRLYAGADALILPSLYEGFGLPPVEAMASGLPVLVSRAASLPEVCGDAALYCDPMDVADMAAQLRRVVADQPLRELLKAKGRARAGQLRWDDAAQAYEILINNSLG